MGRHNIPIGRDSSITIVILYTKQYRADVIVTNSVTNGWSCTFVELLLHTFLAYMQFVSTDFRELCARKLHGSEVQLNEIPKSHCRSQLHCNSWSPEWWMDGWHNVLHDFVLSNVITGPFNFMSHAIVFFFNLMTVYSLNHIFRGIGHAGSGENIPIVTGLNIYMDQM